MSDYWQFGKTEEDKEGGVSETDEPSYEISSYPADFTLQVYANKYERNNLITPPFQRNYVWTQKQASKLIESFLLRLPVPGIFLYKRRGNDKLAVIDGQQRIMSCIRYFNGKFDGRPFQLQNVHSKWEGKTYENLTDDEQHLLADSVLRAIVVQQLDPEDDSSVIELFERLNTGGLNLNRMEIRKCVFHGPLMALLEELNENQHWRKIIGRPKIDKQLQDVELVLRCLALRYGWREYKKPMKRFLNAFMKKNHNAKPDTLAEYQQVFERTCENIANHLPERPFHLRRKLNYAAMDSIFNAVSHWDKIPANIIDLYKHLQANPEFEISTRGATSDQISVIKRFKLVQEILA